MGLEVIAYSNIKFLREYFEDFDYDEGKTSLYVNTHFPDRAPEFKDGIYSFDKEVGFCAGSYGGYNQWRDELAHFAEFEAHETDGYKYPHAETAFNNLGVDKPFYELINFSDCEGVIGKDICVKLLKDFNDFQERAEQFETRCIYFMKIYNSFIELLELAVYDGCLWFH